MDAVQEAAERLYGEAPGDFVRARNAAAGDAGGDAAAAIRRLPKPTTAAWVTNRLAREDADVLRSLIELGDALRAAQDELDPAAIRSLGAERRKVVRRVADRAIALAGDAGVKVGPSVREEVERTLQVALADPAAADAVASGRLVRPLDAAGGDAVDLDGAVAGAAAPRTTPKDDLAERRARAEARRRELELAEAARDAAADARDDAEADRAEADGRVRRIEWERADLRRRLDELDDEAEHAGTDLAAAERFARAARRRAEETSRAVERLTRPRHR